MVVMDWTPENKKEWTFVQKSLGTLVNCHFDLKPLDKQFVRSLPLVLEQVVSVDLKSIAAEELTNLHVAIFVDTA